jgi:hypothetical protein
MKEVNVDEYNRRAEEAEKRLAQLAQRIEALEKLRTSDATVNKPKVEEPKETSILEFPTNKQAREWIDKGDKFWIFGSPWYGKLVENKIIVARYPPLSKEEFDQFLKSNDPVPKRLCSFEQYYQKQMNKENKFDQIKVIHQEARSDVALQFVRSLIQEELNKYKQYAGLPISKLNNDTPQKV